MATVNGSNLNDMIRIGSGQQAVDGSDGNDRLMSLADGGEPGIASPPAANDTLTGGNGADEFEFRALVNATPEVLGQHTQRDGSINWGAVTGENDEWHDHWVEGFGLDTITDYSKSEGDTIIFRGHTLTLDSVTYGSDAGGDYSLITVYSQQGNGRAGGANTATGAHDEDPLGQVKVYGDVVTATDLTFKNSNDGIDQLYNADSVYGGEGVATVYSNTHLASYTGIIAAQVNHVHIGEGSQTVDTRGGNDRIFMYSDGGEPDPAQGGARVTDAVTPGMADDAVSGGQGADRFITSVLLNAKDSILASHTQADGSIDWKGVTTENGNVHDFWLEGIGNDVILDYSKQDGDRIDIQGRGVEIASITNGQDDGGDYSLITLRAQQGAGGAHDEDALGTLKVYGDDVTADDITLRDRVLLGIDELDKFDTGIAVSPAANTAADPVEIQWGAPNPETIEQTFTGADMRETFRAGSGSQTVDAGDGNDVIVSYADAGEPDPAQTVGSAGRINAALAASASDDVFTGGGGADRFEFHALLNARREVIEEHRGEDGDIDWAGVAGENDNVHDHWVEGVGNDVITDFSKAEGDTIVVRGHTMTLGPITYGTDAQGDYSLITIYSDQGNGGAGGANTANGAHDEDPLGTIKVYGDQVVDADVTVQRGGVVDGVDRLPQVDLLADYNGGAQSFASSAHNDSIVTADSAIRTKDLIEIGSGAQRVDAGLHGDVIRSYADAGEPDPAQTVGPDGRITEAVDPELAADIISGGQGKDQFSFHFLLNATDVTLARNTRADGSIDWQGVAGRNNNVHDHWVEGVGNDVILDYSKQDGDTITLRGHTVEIADITRGVDLGGDYSLISVRSQQGDGGGAHDEDQLGTIKVYGDRVTEADVRVQAQGVFDGIDLFEPLVGRSESVLGNGQDNMLSGAGTRDVVLGLGGNDTLMGRLGNDTLVGGARADEMDGGNGSDIYLVSGTAHGFDTYNDTGTTGSDRIEAEGDGTRIGLDGFGPSSGIEDITAAGYADVTISGSMKAETLDFTGVTLTGITEILGRNGPDQIIGSSGDDVIRGGAGRDTLDGADGGDTYLFEGTSDGFDSISDSGTNGTDQILAASDGTQIGLLGFGPDNGIEAISSDGFADVTISGTGGSEVLDFSGVTLTGITEIDAGRGADRIVGSAADDAMRGGAGRDTFVIGADAGDDTILDFTRGMDVVELSGHPAISDFDDVASLASQIGQDVLINLGGGDTLTLTGLQLGDLSESDFLFVA